MRNRLFQTLGHAAKTYFDRAVSLTKKGLSYLLKTAYIGLFFVICMSLLKMLYAPGISFFSPAESTAPDTAAEYTENEEMIRRVGNNGKAALKGHFHIVDTYVPQEQSNPPFCLSCHGIYPHGKDKKTASLINLHVGFTACELCHVRRVPGKRNHFFRWVNRETGDISMAAEGGYGKYAAHITPVKIIDGKPVRLDELIEAKFSEAFEDLMSSRHQPDQKQSEIQKIHERYLSRKPVSCLDCHKKNGYLNFTALGFPASRTNQLMSSEVSRMIEHYETFHIPMMLMPD